MACADVPVTSLSKFVAEKEQMGELVAASSSRSRYSMGRVIRLLVTALLPGLPLIAEGQTLCTPIGSSMYCSGYDRKETIVTPFSNNQGVIQTPDRTIPYTVLPAPARTHPWSLYDRWSIIVA